MIYGYLEDTALTPRSENIIVSSGEQYGSYRNANGELVRGGVGQVTERVLSIFNTEENPQPNGLIEIYHHQIMDPRDTRLQGMFTGSMDDVTGTNYERPHGDMKIHYDQYWAERENVAGNNIEAIKDKTYADQFRKLFNMVETVVYSHTFDAVNKMWVYKTSSELDAVLRTNTTVYGSGSMTEDDITSGYCAGSLTMPVVDYTNDKHAPVTSMSMTDNKIKTTIGTNPTSCNAEVLFPSYIQFAFRFSALAAPTWFRLYLNPDTLFANYPKSRITDVICPADPADLVHMSYVNVESAINSASRYVANIMTGKVTKTTTDPLTTTNHTGAMPFVVNYTIPNSGSRYTFTFTCIYKGRQPTIAEMRAAIKEILETAQGSAVSSTFPGLYVSTSFIVVPMYNSRVTAFAGTSASYCRGIYSTVDFLKNYNGKAVNNASLSDVPDNLIRKASQMVVPSYFMPALIYPENYEASDAVKLDTVGDLESYQPISTEDPYWGSLSDTAREFNAAVSKIIASQLNNTQLPNDVQCSEETKAIFGEGKNRTYVTFCVGDYSFSLMTMESFMNAN